MNLSSSQRAILEHLKQHGGQSVKLLARRLDMTTMGARQHLAALQQQGLVRTRAEARQIRGRPLHLWELTAAGHDWFPDTHRELSLELLEAIRDELGDSALARLIDRRGAGIAGRYREQLADQPNLQARLTRLAELRSGEGFMSEVRLLPDSNWLLIENHCPICAAAEACPRYCESELRLFQELLEGQASVERIDHLLAGDRRCAYKVSRP
jgi:predicted ArsR family transcriptional regulator